MICESCGKEMASFTHYKDGNGDVMIVCVGCRDKAYAKEEEAYQTQKEDDNPDHERDIREEL